MAPDPTNSRHLIEELEKYTSCDVWPLEEQKHQPQTANKDTRLPMLSRNLVMPTVASLVI